MRKTTTALAVTVASALGVTAIAQAVAVDQTLSVKTLGKKGTAKKPQKISLNVLTTTNAKDGKSNGTYGTTQAVIHFDKNLKFNNAKFPTCSEAKISADASKCPSGSKIGSGGATAVVGTSGLIIVNPSIVAWNGPKNTLNLQLITKPGENDASGVIVGKLKNDTGKFGKKLVVTIPKKFQQPVTGLFATLTRFRTKVGRTVNGVNYVESVGCKGTSYKFAGDFTYTDGTSVKGVAAKAKC